MTYEFKPGDVAIRRSGLDGGQQRSLCVPTCPNGDHDRGPHWHNASGGWDLLGSVRRPLVVLDPESDEDVQRLVDAYCAQIYNPNRHVIEPRMRAAIRSLVTKPKPKPPEPMGLGAVVVDRDGRHWVRASHGGARRVWHCAETSAWGKWADIDAIEDQP